VLSFFTPSEPSIIKKGIKKTNPYVYQSQEITLHYEPGFVLDLVDRSEIDSLNLNEKGSSKDKNAGEFRMQSYFL
jgi:hypothetical protein